MVSHADRLKAGIPSQPRQFLVRVEVAAAGQRLRCGGGAAELGPRREHREPPIWLQHALALSQDDKRPIEEEEHDGHGRSCKETVAERQFLGAGKEHLGSRRPLPGEVDHLLAVVDPGRLGAQPECLAQEQPAAAPELEQVVARSERERVEDVPAGEIVDVFGAVDPARPSPGRTSGDAIGQPVLKVLIVKPARPPGLEVLVAETEPLEDFDYVARRSLRAASSAARVRIRSSSVTACQRVPLR